MDWTKTEVGLWLVQVFDARHFIGQFLSEGQVSLDAWKISVGDWIWCKDLISELVFN